jgi:hypothetical protein
VVWNANWRVEPVTDEAFTTFRAHPATHVFVPEPGNATGPAAASDAASYVAVRVSVPGTLEFVVISHFPSLLVVHDAGIGGFGTAVPDEVNVTGAFGSGTKPVPASRSTRTVNVCGTPTVFVAVGGVTVTR